MGDWRLAKGKEMDILARDIRQWEKGIFISLQKSLNHDYTRPAERS
jgi:hypothetical protein